MRFGCDLMWRLSKNAKRNSPSCNFSKTATRAECCASANRSGIKGFPCSEETEFGKSCFGPILPNPFLDLVCVMVEPRSPEGGEGDEGGVQTQRKWGPKGGEPKISRFFFFPLSRPLVRFFCLSGCFLMEFWCFLKVGTLKCARWSSWVVAWRSGGSKPNHAETLFLGGENDFSATMLAAFACAALMGWPSCFVVDRLSGACSSMLRFQRFLVVFGCLLRCCFGLRFQMVAVGMLAALSAFWSFCWGLRC